MSLSSYIFQFQKLHISRSNGIAPHKPVLLISVLDEIENGNIIENRIYITPELVAAFKQNWSVLVDSKIFSPQFALPFFHLDGKGKKIGDKFWHLKTLPGCEIMVTSSNSVKSFAALKSAIDFAYFDEELFMLLMNNDNRKLLCTVLLDTFFANTKQKYIKQSGKENSYIETIENKILNEPSVEYKMEIDNADEEEIFLRGGVFKKVVPRIYNYTCCISGLRIETTNNIQMIDACHIIPFSLSHDDTITNGISLCPNLHRAFDRHLISISDDYRVMVSQDFVESNSDYSIKNFEGKEISLPREIKYFPSIELLRKQRLKII